jgi:hypothetical protein
LQQQVRGEVGEVEVLVVGVEGEVAGDLLVAGQVSADRDGVEILKNLLGRDLFRPLNLQPAFTGVPDRVAEAQDVGAIPG